jgi:lipopolysaccharide transport system permease protein
MVRLVLEAGRTERHYWRDLWRYRELFAILAWRDVAVRYKQTAIGVAWAVIRPIVTMVVFTIVFGHVAKLPTEGDAPYPLMVFAGMLPWFLFATILNDGSNSLITNSNLVGKVYFPRIIIPSSSVLVALVDFAVSFGVLLALFAWYQFAITWRVLLLPFFVLTCVFASAGPSLWLASLNVRYRDFRYVVPFITQFGLYISPVGFSSSAVPADWRTLYAVNPMVGVIEGFRWCLLGGQTGAGLPGYFLSIAVVALMLWSGIVYFRQTEKTFADMI